MRGKEIIYVEREGPSTNGLRVRQRTAEKKTTTEKKQKQTAKLSQSLSTTPRQVELLISTIHIRFITIIIIPQ